MRTEEILATIDHALEDWEVSGDAMRWTPEPPAPRVPLASPRQQGRASWHGCSPARFWVAPAGTPPHHMHTHIDLSREIVSVVHAFEELSLATGLSVQSIADLAERMRESEDLPAQAAEDPRARALRLRQHRHTGPATPRAQAARRPRSHQ